MEADSSTDDLNEVKEELVFCFDFQQSRGCSWPGCKYIHCTSEEEELYRNSGILSENVRSQVARGFGRAQPICKDFLNDCCLRSRCKFRHQRLDGHADRPPDKKVKCDALVEENNALRHEIEQLKRQIVDLRTANDLLLESNATLRNKLSEQERPSLERLLRSLGEISTHFPFTLYGSRPLPDYSSALSRGTNILQGLAHSIQQQSLSLPNIIEQISDAARVLNSSQNAQNSVSFSNALSPPHFATSHGFSYAPQPSQPRYPVQLVAVPPSVVVPPVPTQNITTIDSSLTNTLQPNNVTAGQIASSLAHIIQHSFNVLKDVNSCQTPAPRTDLFTNPVITPSPVYNNLNRLN